MAGGNPRVDPWESKQAPCSSLSLRLTWSFPRSFREDLVPENYVACWELPCESAGVYLFQGRRWNSALVFAWPSRDEAEQKQVAVLVRAKCPFGVTQRSLRSKRQPGSLATPCCIRIHISAALCARRFLRASTAGCKRFQHIKATIGCQPKSCTYSPPAWSNYVRT